MIFWWNIGKTPEEAILVTTDAVGLYPNVPPGAGLEVLRKRLNVRKTLNVPTEELIKNSRFYAEKQFLWIHRGGEKTDVGGSYLY